MNKCFKIFFLLFSSQLMNQSSMGQIRLPSLVRDSMVLQRDASVNIWGWARPGEKVTVQFNKDTYKTSTGSNGKWQVKINPQKAGGPYQMQITGSNRISIKDILVGDVWLCAGQSNMVHQMYLHRERYQKDIEDAHYPMIRQFTIATETDLQKPKEDLKQGYWKAATPNDVMEFSAVAYFFAREIHEKYKIPIGLINASVGGTPIEAWTSEEGLKSFPSILETIRKNKDTAWVNTINRLAAFNNSQREKPDDAGMKEKIKWYESSYDAHDWKSIPVPGYWEDMGLNLDGIVWLRKEILLPEGFESSIVKLSLGRIVDAEEIYINGKMIGSTGYQYPQRRFEISRNVLVPGKNIITVRITNYQGKGGFVPGKPYYITNSSDTIDLKGEWQYRIGDVFEKDMSWQGGLSIQNQPSSLFNGMIAPITPYTIKGINWYQGESNTQNAQQYGQLLPALILDWRKQWKEMQMPFLFVQLPNFGDVVYDQRESSWALLRESQLKTLSLPNTAMAIAIDLGEWNDIHPGNKKDVGLRLAAAARHYVYQEKDVVPSGPLFKSAIAEGNRIVIAFDHTGSGLTTINNEAPNWLYVAGHDHKFLPASALIRENKLVVWNEHISQPVYVRYAWVDNPEGANIINKEGLPASPFRGEVNAAKKPESGNTWNNKKCAVVLTYDDALNVHLTNAIPALDMAGLKGTFYISDYHGRLQSQIAGWKRAAARGHEMGNHTIHHPCAGNLPGREFVQPAYDLNGYTMQRMNDEIRNMNIILHALDGKTQRTFAFPCGDKKIRDSFYLQPGSDFIGARGVHMNFPGPGNANLFDLPAYVVNGQQGSELIEVVKQAMENNGLLVFLFHGVGGEHGLDVSLKAHSELLYFLKQNEKDIWIAPMIDIANYIKTQKTKNYNE